MQYTFPRFELLKACNTGRKHQQDLGLTKIEPTSTYLAEKAVTSNPALSNSPAAKQKESKPDALMQMLGSGSSSAPKPRSAASSTTQFNRLQTNPPLWQGLKHGLVMIRKGKSNPNNRNGANLKHHIEVNPLTVPLYQGNNYLQWKWYESQKTVQFNSTIISRSSVYGSWSQYYEPAFQDLGNWSDLADDTYGPVVGNHYNKPSKLHHWAGATMLLFHLWLPGFHIDLSSYMMELAATLTLEERGAVLYDNPVHFYVSPGSKDIRLDHADWAYQNGEPDQRGASTVLGPATLALGPATPRVGTMDPFILTHFPLELILVEGKMISGKRKIDGHDQMLDILCANQNFLDMLQAIAIDVEELTRACPHQLYFRLGGYLAHDMHSLCNKLKRRSRTLARKLNDAAAKPKENRSRQDDTTVDGSDGETGQ